jgi:hypothetical protein
MPAQYYDAETDEITLSGFSYVEVLPDRRNTLRVKIGGLFQVPIEAGTTTFTAKLKDLSLGGCALEVPDKALLGNFTYFYLNLSFTLQNSQHPKNCGLWPDCSALKAIQIPAVVSCCLSMTVVVKI